MRFRTSPPRDFVAPPPLQNCQNWAILERGRLSASLPLAGLLIVFALAACMPLAFSPEAVAIQQSSKPGWPGFMPDTSSIQVLQKQPLGESQFVLVSFQGADSRTGKQSCLFLYEVRKGTVGWMPDSGGGGCSTPIPDPTQVPLSFNGSTGSSHPGTLGYSAASGEVNRDDIRFVQVTWNDGTLQKAEVINHSYLVLRAGKFNLQKVEALDAASQVVYTHEPGAIAPGKQHIEGQPNGN